jgi:hypothetical protein
VPTSTLEIPSLVLLLTVASVGGCSGRVDGNTSGTVSLACEQSLAAACPTLHCAPTWDAARADTFFCSQQPPGYPTVSDCGGSHLLVVLEIDGFLSYWYDAASGDLVGVDDETNGIDSCIAGPATLDRPGHCDAVGSPLDNCPAGSDAGVD